MAVSWRRLPYNDVFLGCVACSDKVSIYFVVCNDTNSVLCYVK